MKSLKKTSKLTDYEIGRVRDELEKVISFNPVETLCSPSSGNEKDLVEVDRIKSLELALAKEQESNKQICEQLEGQSKRLDAFLNLFENLVGREPETSTDVQVEM